MEIFKYIASVLDPVVLVLLVVIYWLMKQNSQLVDETFKSFANVARLTGLLESLTERLKNGRDSD